jgi:hypothetical protein
VELSVRPRVVAGGVYERAVGAAGRPLAGYRRRTPERTVLHELVAQHAQTMLAELRDADPEGGGLPRYVERELAAYLKCGVLAHGFCRVRCQTCRDEIVVAFSCKSRGICPSCTARRMADTAAHLVTRVLPRAPYRQWVFTVPKLLRLRLARDPAWASWAGQLVVRAIGAWQRRVARERGLGAPRTGAVVFRQRFGGLVNLNVHYHVIVPDGVFVEDGGPLAFAMLPVPTSEDVLAILDRIVRRVAKRLGREPHDDDAPTTPDVLAQVQAEAAASWRTPTDGHDVVRGAERLRAWCEGFSLHAGDRRASRGSVCRPVPAEVQLGELRRIVPLELDLGRVACRCERRLVWQVERDEHGARSRRIGDHRDDTAMAAAGRHRRTRGGVGLPTAGGRRVRPARCGGPRGGAVFLRKAA